MSKELFAAIITVLVIVLFAYVFAAPVRAILIDTPLSILGEPLYALFG